MQDNGRKWGLSWNGYRAVITTGDGKQMWVNLPKPGKATFTEDHLAGGSKGGLWRFKRVPKTPDDLSDCGYNHVSKSN